MNFVAGRSFITKKARQKRRQQKEQRDEQRRLREQRWNEDENAALTNHRVIQVATISSASNDHRTTTTNNNYANYGDTNRTWSQFEENSAVVAQPLNPGTIWNQKIRALGLLQDAERGRFACEYSLLC